MREIPLVRDLRRCSKVDYSDGAKELLTVLVFAFLPLWLGFVFSISSTFGNAEEFFTEFLGSGEALLVSAALVGPLIYVMTRKYGDLKNLTIHFPQGWLFTTLLMLVCVTSSGIFGAKKGFKILDPSKSGHPIFESSSKGFVAISLLVVFASILIFFFVSVFRNFLDRGAPAIMRSSQNSFLSEWNDAHD